MNKELLELLNAIEEQKKLVQKYAAEDKLEEAKEAKNQLKKLQDKFDLLKDIEESKVTGNKGNAGMKPAVEKDSIKEFADAARSRFKNKMNEGTGAEGGYTVPEDIQTKINEYREAKASLIDLVDVEYVTTNKGSRTFKKRSQQSGFTKVGEGAKIQAGKTPQFERIDYEIAKYAGYFPVTNELLEDSDQAIANTLIAWIGDESRVTRNKLILEAVKGETATALKGLDDIKKALNVTLGQAFKPTAKIITNDDGLQYLDTLKDSDGRYMLQPNPTDPAKLQLCAGATIVPIFVVPNEDMPSDTATAKKRKIPMIIGDLKEAVKFFDRKHLTIKTSDIAVIGELNAFEEDLTLFRAIEREDVQKKDPAAVVYGEVTIDDETVSGS